jgi:Gas vesicle protein
MSPEPRRSTSAASPPAITSTGPPATRPAAAPAIQPEASSVILPAASPAARQQRIALVDLLDRVLASGVVIRGEVRLSIADVDMVSISLQALISSVSTAFAHGADNEDSGS